MTETAWQALVVFLALAVVVEGIVLLGALRELGSVIQHIGPVRYGDVGEGPETGTSANLDGLPAGMPSILTFVSPTCSMCKPVSDALEPVQRAYPEVELVPVVVGATEAERITYAQTLKGEARLDLEELFETWNIPGTPYAVGIGENKTVLTSGIVNSLAQLEQFVETVIQAHDHPVDENGQVVQALDVEVLTK